MDRRTLIIIAIIFLILVVLVGAFFGGYGYGSSTCKDEHKKIIISPNEISPEEQLRNNIAAIVNTSNNVSTNTNEGYEENFSGCNRNNSKYKNLLYLILDFFSDQNGQFSRYFKFEEEFDENVVDDGSISTNDNNRKSSLTDVNVLPLKITTNNKIVIDKISAFRQKIISAENLPNVDYNTLFKEYVSEDFRIQSKYGSIPLSFRLSRSIVGLSESDITIIASNIVTLSLPVGLAEFSELGGSVDYEVLFYDKEKDELVFHPDFNRIKENNNKFFLENIKDKVPTNVLKDKEQLEQTLYDIYLKKQSLDNDATIQNIKKIINPGTPQDAIIDQNIKNIQMEKISKELYNQLQSEWVKLAGTTKVSEVFKTMVRKGFFGGGDIPGKNYLKFKTSIYFSKIDGLDINKIPRCGIYAAYKNSY